jgi:hypothetical protein
MQGFCKDSTIVLGSFHLKNHAILEIVLIASQVMMETIFNFAALGIHANDASTPQRLRAIPFHQKTTRDNLKKGLIYLSLHSYTMSGRYRSCKSTGK